MTTDTKTPYEPPFIVALREELTALESEVQRVQSEQDRAQRAVAEALDYRRSIDKELEKINDSRGRIIVALNALGVTS